MTTGAKANQEDAAANDALTADDATAAAKAESTATEPRSTAAESDSTATDERALMRRPGAGRRTLRGARKRIGTIVLTLLLLVSAGVAAWLYFVQYRSDQQTNADARELALNAATTGTVALLSYSPTPWTRTSLPPSRI